MKTTNAEAALRAAEYSDFDEAMGCAVRLLGEPMQKLTGIAEWQFARQWPMWQRETRTSELLGLIDAPAAWQEGFRAGMRMCGKGDFKGRAHQAQFKAMPEGHWLRRFADGVFDAWPE